MGGLGIYWAETTLTQAIRQAGAAVWSPYFRDLTEADLREAQQLGLRVVVWTVNDPADMASLLELGVDGLITDYPDLARQVMAERGLTLPPAFPGK
jgi:glycerophosphoryl diester phosphodiesterase